MANTKAENGEAAETKTETTKAGKIEPTLENIGTLTYPRAVQHFGKENALAAMRKVAEIGGHGHFDDEQFKSPLFGGLQMPDPEKIIEPKKEDFAAMPEADFYYQAAVEEHEKLKKSAGAKRGEINEFYKSLKS